ncbi:MAG: o-succinylbenzoate synthase, partial [Acidimicrobiia bacterium]
MKIEAVELRRIRLPLVSPFRTSFGTQTEREALLLRVRTPEAEGWGECVAMSNPLYSPEYVDAAAHVIEHHLLPRVFAEADVDANGVGRALHPVKGHPMAKAAIEAAVLDAELRAAGVSMARYLGAVRDEVDCGVS